MKVNYFIIFFCITNLFAKLPPPKSSFNKIKSNYHTMLESSSRNKFRHNYIRFVRNFSTFNKIYKNRYNPMREKAEFYKAAIYTDLAFASGSKSDFIIAFNKLNSFKDKTSSQSLIRKADEKRSLILNYAEKNDISQIKNNSNDKSDFSSALKSSIFRINKIFQFKNSITVHTNSPIKYFVKTYPERKNKKIVIELQNTSLNTKTYRKPFLKHSKIKNLKVYEQNPKRVRIEFDIDKNLFPLVSETKEGEKINFAARPWSVVWKARQELQLKPKILIDPGHGGKDPGTIKNGIKEKDLVLSVSKILGRELQKNYFDVHFTRTEDKTLSLSDRADIAHSVNPDIFLSIHANSTRNKRVSGIETYYFDVKSDKITKEIAARENTQLGSISDLDFILQDLTISKHFIDSGNLASKIHNALISGISGKYRNQKIRNRGIRGGPFFVLYNTNTPSILIEIGFLSNPLEAKNLKTKKYQALLAKQITTGIMEYVSKQ